MVKQLNDLVPLIAQRIPCAKKLLATHSQDDLKALVLFELFSSNVIENDESALSILGTEWRNINFRNSARYLHSTLLDLLIFLDFTYSDYNQEFEVGTIKNMQMKLLFYNGKYESACDMAKELIEMGEKFERPSWIQESVYVLINLSSMGHFEKIKQNRSVNTSLNQYKEYIFLENKSIFHSMKILGYLRKNKGYTENAIKMLRNAELDLSNNYDFVPSIIYNVNYYHLKSVHYHLLGDHEEAYMVLIRLIDYLKSRKFQTTYSLSGIQVFLIFICRVLKRFDEARIIADQVVAIAPVGSLNWFSMYQAIFLTDMADKQYKVALSNFIMIISSKFYSYKLSADDKEIWHILGAYLFIAYKLTGQPHPEGLPTYRSSKFLSDVSKYSHDKNGLNASAMIAHLILLHIEDLEGTSKRGGVVDRLEALDKYRQRHLPETIAPRSSLFIEILCKTAEYNFNPKLLTDNAIEREISRLRKMSNNDVAQPFELEIIPYDNLLDLLFNAKKS
jgi:tetratricopeptide (TPR) repeat protein